jgi:hypothetical protein
VRLACLISAGGKNSCRRPWPNLSNSQSRVARRVDVWRGATGWGGALRRPLDLLRNDSQPRAPRVHSGPVSHPSTQASRAAAQGGSSSGREHQTSAAERPESLRRRSWSRDRVRLRSVRSRSRHRIRGLRGIRRRGLLARLQPRPLVDVPLPLLLNDARSQGAIARG